MSQKPIYLSKGDREWTDNVTELAMQGIRQSHLSSESWDYLPKGYSEVRVKDVFPTFGGLKSSLSDSILIGYLEQRLQAVHVSPSISQAPRLMIE